LRPPLSSVVSASGVLARQTTRGGE
jgi:hypothetical protein